MKQRLIPKKYRVLSGSALKLIAVVTMLIDHIGYTLLAYRPVELFTVLGRTVTLYNIARGVGRLAFPLYCFLLVEGFRHTKSRLRYAIGLGVFALVSEIPYNLMTRAALWNVQAQNVFFTLLLGLLGVWAIERLSDRPWRLLIALGALFLAALLSKCDYGAKGFCFILLLYLLRDMPIPRAVVGTGVLPSLWKGGLAFVPIAFYNGRRGFIRGAAAKYAFYLFYPVHILILCWIRLCIFGV